MQRRVMILWTIALPIAIALLVFSVTSWGSKFIERHPLAWTTVIGLALVRFIIWIAGTRAIRLPGHQAPSCPNWLFARNMTALSVCGGGVFYVGGYNPWTGAVVLALAVLALECVYSRRWLGIVDWVTWNQDEECFDMRVTCYPDWAKRTWWSFQAAGWRASSPLRGLRALKIEAKPSARDEHGLALVGVAEQVALKVVARDVGITNSGKRGLVLITKGYFGLTMTLVARGDDEHISQLTTEPVEATAGSYW